jgi:hypothetical protein
LTNPHPQCQQQRQLLLLLACFSWWDAAAAAAAASGVGNVQAWMQTVPQLQQQQQQ